MPFSRFIESSRMKKRLPIGIDALVPFGIIGVIVHLLPPPRNEKCSIAKFTKNCSSVPSGLSIRSSSEKGVNRSGDGGRSIEGTTISPRPVRLAH